MKILKSVKGIVRFKTIIGNITLTDDNKGVTKLSNEEYKVMEKHPLFEAIVKTNGIKILSEENEENSELNNEINLEIKTKAELVLIAKSLNIETKNLNRNQLILAIDTKKKELKDNANINGEDNANINDEDKGN